MHVPGTRVHYGRRYEALFAERGRVSATTTPFPPPPVTDPFNAIPALPSPPRATLFACLADESRAFFFCCTLALPEHRSAATRVQLNYLSRRSSVRFFPLSPFSSPGKISTTCPPVESVVYRRRRRVDIVVDATEVADKELFRENWSERAGRK